MTDSNKTNLNGKYVEAFIAAVFSALCSISLDILLPNYTRFSLILGSGVGAVIGLFISTKTPKFFKSITTFLQAINKGNLRFNIVISIIVIILLLNFLIDVDEIYFMFAILIVILISRIFDWQNDIKEKLLLEEKIEKARKSEIERKKQYEESVKAQFKSEEEYLKWKEKKRRI